MSENELLEEIVAKLRSLGLTTYEARAYLVLVKRGVMTSTEIAREARIPQPRVYDVLRGLEEKGLILVSEGRPRLYRAEEPRVALKRLLEAIERRIREEYERTVNMLENIITRSSRTSSEDIWKIESTQKIKDKLLEVVENAEYELLVSAYKHVLSDITNRLKRLSRRGVSVCLVMFDEVEPQKYVDEHRFKATKGIVIAIPDRKNALFVTNWYNPQQVMPSGFYTENKHLLRFFTEYFLHNLRDLSKPVYVAFGEKVFIRKFVNITRAIDMIRILMREHRKIHVKVSGWNTRTNERIVVEGEPVNTVYDVYNSIARITIKTSRGETITIGGWGATLEDVEAEVIEVIS